MDPKTLSQAISDVEKASTSLQIADNGQQAAQTKYDDALAAKTQADKDDADAVAAFNSTLDALIASATAAKVDRSGK